MTASPNTITPSEWAEPARTLVRHMDLESSIVSMGADSPIDLEHSEVSWLVLSGFVIVFSVDNETGTREHLYRVDAGGVGAAQHVGQAVWFVGAVQCKVVQVQARQPANDAADVGLAVGRRTLAGDGSVSVVLVPDLESGRVHRVA